MIDVTATHFLECKEYEPGSDGSGVSYYLLRAIPKEGGVAVTIRLKPGDLTSCKRFKEALLGRCILYSSSKAEHGKNLLQLMCRRPQPSKSFQPNPLRGSA